MGFHPDHQATGRLTLAAVFDAGVRLLFPSAGSHWRPTEFYMWEFLTPTHYIALSNSNLHDKILAYEQHTSQYQTKEMVVGSLTALASQVAINSNVTATYAEGFVAYF